jgi:uncharacterized protein YPO0396
MTMEKYVEGLKELLPEHFIDSIKDWSVSDRMYVSLHYIQIKQMEEYKESLRELKALVHAKCK